MQASESHANSSSEFGAYDIVKRIAVGGSAEVFVAHKRGKPGQQLVLKRLLPAVRARGDLGILEREAKLHRQVNHANVVKVHYAGEVSGEPYIAMEYVHGLDLHRVLQRSSSNGQAIPHDLAVFIVRNIADALAAVHAAKDDDGAPLNIVHGDVSPSNIYLSVTGEVKLGDFGIARVVARRSSGTDAGRATGHFGYLAPEQLAGESHDQAADIFSLGVILGELLIGRRVFPGSGQLAIMLSMRDANILPLRQAAHKLPPGLFEVCEKALQRSPKDRFPSAAELSQALQEFAPDGAKLQKALASWVNWALDHDRFVENLEKRVRQSVNQMHAAHRSSSGLRALPREHEDDDSEQGTPTHRPHPQSDAELSLVKRSGSMEIEEVAFPRLIEMVATGELTMHDEVALWGAPFEPVGRIEELARHLLPSTTGVTGRMFSLNPPDFVADFRETSFLVVLGKLYIEKTTGSVFVSQSFKDREHRKDIYVRDGRLWHVASNDPQELLGEYLVNQGVIQRAQLVAALKHMAASRGQLGETLIALGMADPVAIFTAIRNQGRDRVASLCAWREGNAQLYVGATPENVQFPLDLDLTIPMMWGAMLSPLVLPNEDVRIRAGEGTPAAGYKASSVALLNLVPALAHQGVSIRTARDELATASRRKSEVATRQADAALRVAHALGWLTFA